MALNEALRRQEIGKDNRLVIRSDNGTQMTSHQFRKHIEELGIHHEFTPFSCPEKNAYVEAFFPCMKWSSYRQDILEPSKKWLRRLCIL